ncbi:hypothetical protein ABZ953_00895 [Streptomyces sp. NPDC046465]
MGIWGQLLGPVIEDLGAAVRTVVRTEVATGPEGRSANSLS